MGSPYLDPGNVTGNWGLLPETEIAACNATKLRKAIFAFKKEQGFLFSTDTFNSVDYNIVENDLSDIWLNNNSVTRIIEPVD